MNDIKIKYVYDELKDSNNIRTTEELIMTKGEVQIGPVNFIISKIGNNHISIEIDTNKSPNAKFILSKEFFGKTIKIPVKGANLNIGSWLDFSDGNTNIRHAIYLSGINQVRGK